VRTTTEWDTAETMELASRRMDAPRTRLSAAWGRVRATSRHARRGLAGDPPPDPLRISAAEWNSEYANGDWTRLDDITEVAHYMVIVGFLDYTVTRPTVLDIGCGHGRLSRLLARFGFSHYLGVDFSVAAVQRAQSLSIPGARFEVADMNDWDTNERFDAVVLNESLYYAEDPMQVFARALGWLGEDGIVIVSMFKPAPGAPGIWSQIDSQAVDALAASTVIDQASGNTWDIKALRPSR
jgi:2-polyprenyl-3-methyl-5-hydroxy-6-metoxy-1,4-benzoquinol methylase